MRVAYLHGADLAKANLQGASIFRAHLQGADLRNADLRGVDMRGAELDGANLTGAIFDATTVLPDGKPWTLDTDLTRFTDRAHPDFWRYHPPADWASVVLERKRQELYDRYQHADTD